MGRSGSRTGSKKLTQEDSMHGRKSKCPIRPACPFVVASKCSVYGYSLDKTIGWLKFCPQYDWRTRQHKDEYHHPFSYSVANSKKVIDTEALTI